MHLICLTMKNNPALYLVEKGRFGGTITVCFMCLFAKLQSLVIQSKTSLGVAKIL